jgi:hypothetical protein
VVRSGVSDLTTILSDPSVQAHLPGWAMLASLLAVNVLALILLRFYQPGLRILVLLCLTGLARGTREQFFQMVAYTSAVFWTGQGTLEFAEPGNPDPVTRLEETYIPRHCSICDPRWVGWNNATLRLHTWLFGSSPLAYRGPYPDEAEARALIEERGVEPQLGLHDRTPGRQNLLVVEDHVFELDPFPDDVWAHVTSTEPHETVPWRLVEEDFTEGEAGRVVLLDRDTLLVEVGDAVEIRRWTPRLWGWRWARWPEWSEEDRPDRCR